MPYIRGLIPVGVRAWADASRDAKDLMLTLLAELQLDHAGSGLGDTLREGRCAFGGLHLLLGLTLGLALALVPVWQGKRGAA